MGILNLSIVKSIATISVVRRTLIVVTVNVCM